MIILDSVLSDLQINIFPVLKVDILEFKVCGEALNIFEPMLSDL